MNSETEQSPFSISMPPLPPYDLNLLFYVLSHFETIVCMFLPQYNQQHRCIWNCFSYPVASTTYTLRYYVRLLLYSVFQMHQDSGFLIWTWMRDWGFKMLFCVLSFFLAYSLLSATHSFSSFVCIGFGCIAFDSFLRIPNKKKKWQM